jgi:hypothetical protein
VDATPVISFAEISAEQKGRIKKIVLLYLEKRKEQIAEKIIHGLISGRAILERPSDKCGGLIEFELGYHGWDAVLNTKSPMAVDMAGGIDDHCLAKAYRHCRASKRIKRNAKKD